MKTFDSPEDVNLRLVDYSGFKHAPLNGLLYSPKIAASPRRRFSIVTLHGGEGFAMGGINIWLAPYLASKGYTVIAPNKRNSGRFFYTSEFDHCQEDIASVLAYLETKLPYSQDVLVGHSMGAAEAVYYQAKTQDKKVLALVLMGAPLWPENIWQGRSEMKSRLNLAYDHLSDETPFFLDGDYSDGMYVTARHFVSYWSPDSNNNIRKWIGKVTVPILLVDGSKSLNVLCNPESSLQIQKLASSSPKVDCKIMQDTSHSFMVRPPLQGEHPKIHTWDREEENSRACRTGADGQSSRRSR